MTAKPKANPQMAMFFIFSVLFLSFFLFNMFIGVVVSAYNRKSERIGKSTLLTNSQKQWIDHVLKANYCKPMVKILPPKQSFRLFFYNIATSK